MVLAMVWSASSTSGEKHFTPWATLLARPESTAVPTSVSRFLERSAETSTTGTPSILERRLESIFSPRCSSRSHMLRPTTTGRPVSRSCVVR